MNATENFSVARNAETSELQRLRETAPDQCPICSRDHGDDWEGDDWLGANEDDIHKAAHCCLWKTHDHAARVRIAARVEAGSDWYDAIQGERK